MMKRALILYFSGTGNTEYIGNKISLLLKEMDFNVEIHSIEESFQFIPDQYDMLILGCPKYYEYPALNFIKYLKENVPVSEKTIPAFIYCTQASSLKTNFNKIDRILKKKNYSITISHSFAVANNMVIISSFPLTPEDTIQSNLESVDQKLKPLLTKFMNNKVQKEMPTLFYQIVGYLSGHIVSKLFPIFGMKYSTTQQCIGCGICAQKCPSNNIKMCHKKPQFGKDCIFCMRCINQCPEHAIMYHNKSCSRYKKL